MLGRLEAKLLAVRVVPIPGSPARQRYAALAGEGILQCGAQQRHLRLPSNENGLVASREGFTGSCE